jgi:hypothetical protein
VETEGREECMSWRTACAWIVGAPLLVAGTADEAAGQAVTLALEGGVLSLSSDWEEESPAGSGLLHRGSLDADDPAYGLSVELRVARHVGIRGGLSWSSVPIHAEVTCPDPVCTFIDGPITVIIDDVTWSVDDDSELRLLFLEVPLIVEPDDRVELFAGPTIAHLALDDVHRAGLDGLAVLVDPSFPSYGLHLGGSVRFGWRRNWSAGLLARWIRSDLELAVVQPLLGAAGDLLTMEPEEDLLTVGLVVGRRFGRSREK